MESGSRSKHIGLRNMSKKSDDVAKYYDNWASDYDGTLSEWRYDAPEQVASMLQAKLSPKSLILDAGCGTGLSGRYCTKGFTTIHGIDASHHSLDVADTICVYRSLNAVDLQRFPFRMTITIDLFVWAYLRT